MTSSFNDYSTLHEGWTLLPDPQLFRTMGLLLRSLPRDAGRDERVGSSLPSHMGLVFSFVLFF